MSEKEEIILDNKRPLFEVMVEFETFLLRKLKPSSVKVYMAAIKRYFNDGNKIDSPQNYLDFIIDHMIKKRSSHYYDIILKFVNWINIERDKKKLILSTILGIRKKYHDPVKKTSILTRHERLNIIESLDSYKHQIIGLIQEECGVRAGDVLNLKRGSIDYSTDDGEVIMVISFIGKGDKARIVHIYNKESKEKIQTFIRTKLLNSEYYFIEDKNVRNKYDTLNLIKRNYDLYYIDLQKTCKRLSQDPTKFTSHDIRRNYAVDMFNNVVDKNVVELQKLMGHANIESTVRYLRHSGLDTKDYQKKRNNLNNF